MKLDKLIKPYRIESGDGFKLKHIDPNDTAGLESEFRDEAKNLLQQSVAELAELQDKLYAHNEWSLLLVFQAMDAAGKDSTIKQVMSGVNPQGCEVHSFKAPSSEELDHDFLWRSMRKLPERGRIGIFNRSYYEEVLVVRVHPALLAKQQLPAKLVTKHIWAERCQDIRHFEDYLGRNGTVIRKFFLHVSQAEQKRRFYERLNNPEKNWKFSAADIAERQYWDQYMAAYEYAIQSTATPQAPWFVVPADNKWFTRLVVIGAIIDALKSMKLGYPDVSAAEHEALTEARRKLDAEGKT
ncbi:PPK2 family polyphosphate:nucleotide phosphotransferase [Chitinivorax tropicus]|uniref:PPK2 family polyphosphate:nucleotide phosphotransferase n=1 Tax=Chitinivorax tropicus TaxID=714531 RepID=A0A840MJA0_9PROT|nr:polyphosphate kinase 2 family protein [Chitinivorax tropicus]MBB5017585.1 PPK2 family polyphosphate:nucleotide phosphotransferase [Chitinivorax tropicus]